MPLAICGGKSPWKKTARQMELLQRSLIRLPFPRKRMAKVSKRFVAPILIVGALIGFIVFSILIRTANAY
jgi:hypothetical protein